MTFVIPIAFGNPGQSTKSGFSRTVSTVHTSCSHAEPSSLISWGLKSSETANGSKGSGQSSRDAVQLRHQGAAMGCTDGSVYIFQTDSPPPTQRPMEEPSPSPPIFTDTQFIRSTHRLSHLSLSASHSRSGSPSPSSSLSKFSMGPNLVQKARVVSGVSKENVEAPKNFVDFEDEQEKLREMVKDHVVKEKSLTDNLMPHFEKNRLPIASEKPSSTASSSFRMISSTDEPQRRRKDDARSLLSIPDSVTAASSSTSTPSSPKFAPTSLSAGKGKLVLRSHFIPPRTGFSHSISCMKELEDGELLLCLQESGFLFVLRAHDGICIANADIKELPKVSGNSNSIQLPPHILWSWKYIHIRQTGETQMVIVCASPAAESITVEDEAQDSSRICMFELRGLAEWEFDGVELEKLGDFYVDGPASGINLCAGGSDDDFSLLYLTTSFTLMTQTIRRASSTSRLSLETDKPHSSSETNLVAALHLQNLQLQNPFKKLRHVKSSNPIDIMNHSGYVDLGEATVVGQCPLTGGLKGSSVLEVGKVCYGAIWSDRDLTICSIQGHRLEILCSPSMENITVLHWHNADSFTIVSTLYDALMPWPSASAIEYTLRNVETKKTTKEIDDSSSVDERHYPVRPEAVVSSPLPGAQRCTVLDSSSILTTTVDSKGHRRLNLVKVEQSSSVAKKPQKVWTASASFQPVSKGITSLLPIDNATYVIGYCDGSLQMSDFADLIKSDQRMSLLALEKNNLLTTAIVTLFPFQNARTKERLIIGGGDDGSIFCWDMKLQQKARWIVFNHPLAEIAYLHDDVINELRDHLLCVSEDGTVAVIDVDHFKLTCVIPGAAGALMRVCVSEDELLLFYADGRARLWDMKTKEFRRSTTPKKAEELLAGGHWFQKTFGKQEIQFTSLGMSRLARMPSSIAASSAILADAVAATSILTRSLSVGSKEKEQALDVIRWLISAALTPGLDETIDHIAHEQLGIPSTDTMTGIFSESSGLTFHYTSSPFEPWQISSEATASRLLLILTLLRALLNVPGYEAPASMLITFYTTSLPEIMGPAFQAPSLSYLGRQSQSSASEVRQAARILFDGEAARLSADEVNDLVEQWKTRLPSLLPGMQKQSSKAALALFICGNLAIARFSLLSANALIEIAKSLSSCLFDEDGLNHRLLAIDICSRGFQIWQNYFDAMAVMRSLFSLATDSRKENINVRTSSAQREARLAILQIASDNTPLFTTTLSLDILSPRSAESSRSIMQLIAYILRKKPLVLYPNLPRLLEAVVKSLDPNTGGSRDAVLDAATEILSQVVRTFPTVDFHMTTQRLAVGTNEGAVIMYDLKTATRLYVLEGHRNRLTGISFSPDGRRLVTLSLEESVVLVWKVGSSFTSFFMPGAPPRQGGSGGGHDPYKTLNFNVGNDANMTVADSLALVRFEWPADRSVRLKIRESTLTFST